MKQLTKRSENLLKEILDHRLRDGSCDTQYWKDRFYSLSTPETELICSQFRELKEADMVSVTWADNYPYQLFLLDSGLCYFEEKNREVNNKVTNSNYFYGPVNGVQIQQGTYGSSQNQAMNAPLDEKKIKELIETIHKYDSQLDQEYGVEKANELRKATDELERLEGKPNSEGRKHKILAFIRDLSVNAVGGLIATGIAQLVVTLLRGI